jgi:endoglucanase
MLLESGGTGEVVRYLETHGKKKEELSCYDLYLRTGAKTLEGANERAPVGSWAVFDSEPQRLDSDVISGPYADNIAGCITLLLAMEQLKNTPNDLYFAFTVMQRPIPGSRGVQPVAYNIRPFACITVDGTGTCDTLGTKLKGPLRVGNGPGIKVKEDRYLSDTLVLEHLRGAAKKAGIAYQTEIWPLGSTDMVNPTGMGEMAFVQEACGGIFSGGISIPVRSRNTPQEEYSAKDVREAAMLLASALEEEIL